MVHLLSTKADGTLFSMPKLCCLQLHYYGGLVTASCLLPHNLPRCGVLHHEKGCPRVSDVLPNCQLVGYNTAPNYKCTTAAHADACATYSQARHDASLRAVAGYCRQRCTAEVTEELRNAGPAAVAAQPPG